MCHRSCAIDYICRYGAARHILSDGGTQFLSEIVAAICKVFRVHKQNSTVYHPETDGLIERFNGTIEAALKCYAAEDHDHWNVYLPLIKFTYNTSYHPSIDMTPFEALYGYQA